MPEVTVAKPVIITLAQHSGDLARRLARGLGGEWHAYANTGSTADIAADVTFADAMGHIRQMFSAARPIIGICAPGILIRAIAPVLASGGRDKHSDPPVVAVAADGKCIIPLLASHHSVYGGATALAEACAAIGGGVVASTNRLGVVLDDPPPPLVLADLDQAKPVLAALNAGARLRVVSDLPARLDSVTQAWRAWLAPLLQAKPNEAADSDRHADDKVVELCLTLHPIAASPTRMVFHPRIIALGVGASRHCPPEALAELLATSLARHNLSRHSIGGVYSIDKKIDEVAIVRLAADLGVSPRFFSSHRLLGETARLATPPSEAVFAATGAYGVAEAAALAAAGDTGWLLVAKQKTAMATLALAVAPSGFADGGRRRGKLCLVGMGPGGAEWRTPQAIDMLRQADEIVGYRLYLDLLGGVIRDKPQKSFKLGEETARCRYAITQARAGKTIALVSSGDAGVYGMASLVYELLAGAGLPFDFDLVASAGIPAHIAAATASGALLGHDHAIISLSDLLTPWEVIAKRIEAAAQADFVIALYNPVSANRQNQLMQAREILLRHRPESTPVVLARNIGRAGACIQHRSLATLSVDEVDMLTMVLVGSRQSRQIQFGDATRVFTPRGYDTKAAKET